MATARSAAWRQGTAAAAAAAARRSVGVGQAAPGTRLAQEAVAWPLVHRAPEGQGSGDSRQGAQGHVCLFAAAGAAGALALALLPSSPSRCYYKQLPDGSTDRLTRWAGLAWNIPSGSSPVFHVKGVNPLLQKHLPRAAAGLGKAGPEGAEPLAALVPLCGKAFDLPYLCEQGFGVVGVEGVSRAIHEFRSEQKIRVKGLKTRTVLSRGPDGEWLSGEHLLEPAETFRGARTGSVFKKGQDGLGYYADFPAAWHGKVRAGGEAARPLHLIEADIFEVDPSLMAAATFTRDGTFDFVYDRSALDVIPPPARAEYVSAISRLLRPGGRVLLVVLDYDQSQVPVDPTGRRRTPPPYSVTGEQIRELFPADSWDLEVLETLPEAKLSRMIPAFRGLYISEVVYMITKREGAEQRSKGSMKYIGGAILGALGVGVALLFSRGG
uniref:Thiopurine S-methyltransferase n=1 Tax=Alexandrium monilatum TaxID=311494 RepID=A0A7S4UUT3_9DINO